MSRARSLRVVVPVAVVLGASLLSSRGPVRADQDTGLVPPCPCTADTHQTHVSVVALVTVKPQGRKDEQDELAGSLTHLCRHEGSNKDPDGIVWHNQTKARKDVEVRFTTGWPFAGRESVIVVPAGQTSAVHWLRRGGPEGRFNYVVAPRSAGAPGEAGLMKAPGMALPQPGPAVVVDD